MMLQSHSRSAIGKMASCIATLRTVTKTVTLTVTDKDTGLKHSDTVTITVRPPPEADAGDPQTVGVNTAVSFDGSGSEGSDLNYSWVFGADAAPLTGSGEMSSCTYSDARCQDGYVDRHGQYHWTQSQ